MIENVKKNHYAALAYCVMKDKCVQSNELDQACLEDVCKLTKTTSDWDLKEALDLLVGPYVMQDTGVDFPLFLMLCSKLLQSILEKSFQTFL